MPIKTMRHGAIQAKRFVKSFWDYIYVARAVKHIAGPTTIHRGLQDGVVVSLMRDAESYIEAFIEYHLDLGFKHLFLLDNGSADATLALASQYDQVTIIQCLLPYKIYKDALKRYLAYRFSAGHWCLIADVDEFFSYPGHPTLSLENFIQYLNIHQYDAVLLQMLDMYPNTAILTETNRELKAFRHHHTWFEVESIVKRPIPEGLDNTLANPNLKLCFGGVRQRVFNSEPLLSKFCFMKPGPKLYQVNHHLVSFAAIADISCVLLHYKFLENFPQLVQKAIAEQQYYEGSAEYKNYQTVLKNTAHLSLMSDQSHELRDVQQLVDLGLLDVSPQYLAYCEATVAV